MLGCAGPFGERRDSSGRTGSRTKAEWQSRGLASSEQEIGRRQRAVPRGQQHRHVCHAVAIEIGLHAEPGAGGNKPVFLGSGGEECRAVNEGETLAVRIGAGVDRGEIKSVLPPEEICDLVHISAGQRIGEGREAEQVEPGSPECYGDLASLDVRELGGEYDEFDGPDAVPFLRFSGEAQEWFSDWHASLEHKVRGDDLSGPLLAHMSKYRGLIPRLALVCHVAGNGFGPVSMAAARQAEQWAEYLESHARRAYTSITLDNAEAARAIWRRIRKDDLAASFTHCTYRTCLTVCRPSAPRAVARPLSRAIAGL